MGDVKYILVGMCQRNKKGDTNQVNKFAEILIKSPNRYDICEVYLNNSDLVDFVTEALRKSTTYDVTNIFTTDYNQYQKSFVPILKI